MNDAINNLTKNPLLLAGGVVLVIGFVYWLGRKTITDTADGAAGLISGNNAITQNQTDFDGNPTSAYEGKGVFGTVGGAFNAASGGLFASVGGALGRTLYDWTHNDETITE